jgi:membrane protease YdiL (CAAX protease family)
MSIAMHLQPGTRALSGTPPRKLRGWLEVASIPILLVIGTILGALTGFPPMTSIGAIGLALAGASFYLRREGVSWVSLIGPRTHSANTLAGYVLLAICLATAGAYAITWVLLNLFGSPPIDISRFVDLVQGNPVMYAWYLLPIAWGTAAVGEELLCRGFLLHRIEGMSSTIVAVVLQALIFSVVHAYQGITGMAAVFTVALAFGAVYIKCGRSLVPLIVAHGIIDTFAMTAVFLGRPDLLMGT